MNLSRTNIMVTSAYEFQAITNTNRTRAMHFLIDAIKLHQASAINPTQLSLTNNPAQAELIIFAESHQNDPGEMDISRRVQQHAIYKQYKAKSIIHNGKDIPNPLIPGLYPSLSQKWTNRLGSVGAPYLCPLNPFLESVSINSQPPIKLASFVGSCRRKPIRQQLLANSSNSSWDCIKVIDTSSVFVGTLRSNDTDGHDKLKETFADHMSHAKFALCPRGAGASSFRIFEAMQVARPPVIIADSWSPPPGPDWDSFSIRVPYSQINLLPAILQERESQWESMSKLARQAWESHYSPTQFGLEIVRLANHVLDLQIAQSQHTRIFSSLYKLGPKQLATIKAKLYRRSA